MSAPKRIQRQRTKGWRMPEGAVYVGRPSKWGNPFPVGPAVYYQQRYGSGAGINDRSRSALQFYRRWLSGDIFDCTVREYDHLGIPCPRPVAPPPSTDQIRRALAGRDLACWCPLDSPCHADVLLEIANAEADR